MEFEVKIEGKRVTEFIRKNKKACLVAAIALPIMIRQHNTIVAQRQFIFYKGLEDEYYGGWLSMLERFKKFKEEHEPEIAKGLLVVGTTMVAVGTIGLIRVAEGRKIRSVRRRIYEDGTLEVLIFCKNPTNDQAWQWLPDAA